MRAAAEVDPQNAMVVKTAKNKLKGMVVRLPGEIDPNCIDHENACKATVRQRA